MNADSRTLTIGVVVLTDGTRRGELSRVVASLNEFDLDERILIANGTLGPNLPDWTVINTAENLGVPGGRSLGIAESSSDVLLFLDDDSLPRSANLVEECRWLFQEHPSLGALGFRVVVTDTEETLARWQPSHRPRIDSDLADAVTFPGNGHALRVKAFREVGGYTTEFFFKHEETELAWKLLDAGWMVGYAAGLTVEHPRTSESRNPVAQVNTVRNKIWLARLLLPRPLSWFTIGTSILLALVCVRSTHELANLIQGSRAGIGQLPRARNPISWSTVRSLGQRGRWPTR